jgi:hypothetical protein
MVLNVIGLRWEEVWILLVWIIVVCAIIHLLGILCRRGKG